MKKNMLKLFKSDATALSDFYFLVAGEDPTVEGFFHCCGFNSAGMMLGGGCGDQIAKWVVHGRPEIDMFGYDIRRYHTPLNANKPWVLERSHESYAKNYSIVFPHDEPLAGRSQRRSPLHNVSPLLSLSSFNFLVVTVCLMEPILFKSYFNLRVYRQSLLLNSLQ